ncbi:MAG TPA: BamA/TamA family outer membrane protein, partial [Longimicrobiaceae bacterium]|nr:BamA/TamA family outer membrane protein [Longimicrobiaceae bacterium]
REVVYDPVFNDQGQLVSVVNPRFNEETEDLDAANLFETSAALVYDASLLAYTSPFAGRRYRFEIAPTFGDLDFIQALADYRQYLWRRPFTLALRGFHFGRYGSDAEDQERISPLFLGYPSLLRGYEYGSVADACVAGLRQDNAVETEIPSCQVLDQLFGSRVAVASAELRFPLIRQIVFGGGFGLPPIEGFGFFDAGVSWTRDTDPVFARGLRPEEADRGIFTSIGVGARINLFGYLILEVDYVNPLDRERGWHWQFAAQPGF